MRRAGARPAWAVPGQDVVMVGWTPSAAAGRGSSENRDSEEPQTAAAAAAVCAAEPGSWVESGCMLGNTNQNILLFRISECTPLLCSINMVSCNYFCFNDLIQCICFLFGSW